MPQSSLRTLLYRYFFFNWLFRDVGKGSRHERRVAWQHNLRQARWLPVYLRRWLALATLFYLQGAACEVLLQAQVVSAGFFVAMAVSASVSATVAALILGFRFLPAPT